MLGLSVGAHHRAYAADPTAHQVFVFGLSSTEAAETADGDEGGELVDLVGQDGGAGAAESGARELSERPADRERSAGEAARGAALDQQDVGRGGGGGSGGGAGGAH